MAETLVERIHALARKCAEQDALLKSLIAEVNVESLEKPYTAYKADPADIVLDKLQDGALVVTDSPATTNFRLPNVGEIVTSLTPLDDPALHLLDGAKLSMNGMYKEGLEKIIASYDSTPITPNVQKVGNLVENGTEISGFSSTNYAKLPYAFNPGNNPWEMVFKVTTGGDVTTGQVIFGSLNDSDTVNVYINSNNKFHLLISSDNVSYIVDGSGTYNVQVNTTYYLRLKYTGSVYTLEYSTDGTTYVTDISQSSSTPVHNGSSFNFGIDYYQNQFRLPFLGSIDLSASYININNTRWWSGTKRGIFTTEAEWQFCVNQHGACGKFVYDSVARTVRLPKVFGFIEGTLDSSTLGDLVEAGLPGMSGRVYISRGAALQTGAYESEPLSPFRTSRYSNSFTVSGTNTTSDGYYTDFDASRSSPVYGNSNTVQPQSTKVFYYIVLANTISTPVVADIQREVDSKVNASEAAHAAMPNWDATINFPSLSISTNWQALSTPAPADGYLKVQAVLQGDGKSAAIGLRINGSQVPIYNFDASNTAMNFVTMVPVNAGDTFEIYFYLNIPGTSTNFCNITFFYANGSAPTNS